MILSYSNNFAVIRSPKTGSTSLVSYFFKSGLVDFKNDVYSMEASNIFFEGHSKEHGKPCLTLHATTRPFEVHRTFDDLLAKGAVKPEMPCVGSIREPLARMSSWFNYNKGLGLTKYDNPNSFWDGFKNQAFSQSSYFPKHAILFNTENLHEHVSKYILSKGGKVEGRINARKNPNNNLEQFLAELTTDRKHDILATYVKDLELWEKAYAVYN
jgi:hypothetical protein